MIGFGANIVIGVSSSLDPARNTRTTKSYCPHSIRFIIHLFLLLILFTSLPFFGHTAIPYLFFFCHFTKFDLTWRPIIRVTVKATSSQEWVIGFPLMVRLLSRD